MSIFNVILAVARYEAKTLFRSWFFRIFALLFLILIGFFDWIFFVWERSASWTFMGLPAGVPYANMLFLNLLQAIVAIFLASDFLKFDRKLDTTDVIYMRSMTNASYVLGKVLGVLLVFILLNAIVLAVGAGLSVFFSEMPFHIAGYLFYPLVISLPTLVFIFGLTFLLMILLRSQALVFVLMLGFIVSSLFFLHDNFHSLLDYTAFSQALAWSDFIGPGDIAVSLYQRAFFLLTGIGLTLATVLLLRRLPQNTRVSTFCAVGTVVCLAGAVVSATRYVGHFEDGSALRARMLTVNERYAELPPVSVRTERIELEHTGNSISGSAALDFSNKSSGPLERYRFSLNPGLEVTRVTRGGAELPFEREQHVLLVDPGTALAPEAADSLTIDYAGKIDQAACYLDIDDSTRYSPFSIAFFTAAKQYAIVTPGYLLLTPEAGWYPVSSLPESPAMPAGTPTDYIRFKLSLKTSPELNAISAGVRDSLGEGRYTFEPENPLPRIDLVAGEYDKLSLVADSVEYALYILHGHDFFSQYFPDITEKLPDILKDFTHNLENRVGMNFPFKRMSLVETPIQFKAYERPWETASELIQPEQVLVPEKGLYLQGMDFRRINYYRSRGMQRFGRNQSPEDLQTGMINEILRNSFGETGMAGMQRRVFGRSMGRGFSIQRIAFSMLSAANQVQGYSIFPMFYGLSGNISSTRWPVLGMAFDNYLRRRLANEMPGFFTMIQGPTPEEEAGIVLAKHSLTDVLSGAEYSLYRKDVLGVKSDLLFGMVESDAGEKAFKEFTKEFLEAHRFEDTQATELLDSLNSRFGIELQDRLDGWLNETRIAAFLFGKTDCREVLDGNRTRYQVSIQVSNTGEGDGLLSLSSRAERGGRGGDRFFGRGGGGAPSQPEKIMFRVAAGKSEELNVLLDETPHMLDVNTYLSKNIPAKLHFRLSEPLVDHEVKPFEGKREIEGPLSVDEPGTIIIDNEDPGFKILKSTGQGKLKSMLAREDTTNEQYQGIYFWNPPRRWAPAVYTDFYGTYRHSAHYIRAGSGENRVSWTADIEKPGQYDVFCYVTKIDAPWMRRGRGGRHFQFIADFNFTVHHDDGEEQIKVDAAGEETGWVLLNTWYFSAGKAVVELSNLSKGRMVYADAVKWVEHR